MGQDFFKKMVHSDPTQRFTSNLSLNHPWLTGIMNMPIPMTSV